MLKRWLPVALLIALMAPWSGARAQAPELAQEISLAGRLLVADPSLEDPWFGKTVVLMIDHNAEGAFGLIVNRVLGTGRLKDFLDRFGHEFSGADAPLTLHFGGPVGSELGFVIHSPDYADGQTRTPAPGIALTHGLDIIAAIAAGKGPAKYRMVFGYAGWGPGQLESEFERGDWTHAPPDAALIFDTDIGTIWPRALKESGLTL